MGIVEVRQHDQYLNTSGNILLFVVECEVNCIMDVDVRTPISAQYSVVIGF